MRANDRPLIGITSSMSDNYIRMNKAYFEAVYAAGGMPVFLPFAGGAASAARFTDAFDGYLFAGGVDVDPAFYGEEVTGNGVEINRERDEFELALFAAVFPTGKPMLGICRGVQLFNVAAGGSLNQDIPGHSQSEPGDVRQQSVTVTEGSLLHRLVGRDKIQTNSFHHQSIKVPAPGFAVTAYADNMICGGAESLEYVASPDERLHGRDPRAFFLGVQWHPELFAHLDSTSSAIFKAFIDAAR